MNIAILISQVLLALVFFISCVMKLIPLKEKLASNLA